jgi:hypothetical protein
MRHIFYALRWDSKQNEEFIISIIICFAIRELKVARVLNQIFWPLNLIGFT